MKNAKEEFLNVTENYKVIASVISLNISENEDHAIFKLKPLYTKQNYEDFLKFLNREYDNGYGGQELFGVIYCEDGIWIDRGEYDGSEWWDTHQYPDLRQIFDEADVIKYERNIKLKNINNKI